MAPPRKRTLGRRQAPSGRPSNPGLGIAFIVLATLVFSLQDGISKHLASNYNPIFLVMVRYWAFGVFVLALSWRSWGGIASVARSRHPTLQFFRGMLLGIQVCIIFWCFANLGLISTHIVFASFPLMVTVLSAPFLGERVGRYRWLAVLAGFIGMVIIIGPGSSSVSLASLIPLGATLMFSTYYILTSYVGRTDSPETSFFWTGIGGAATLSFIGPFFWDSMTRADWLWMLALSVMATLGHYLVIRALAIAEASSIQPFSYLQLVFASLIGLVVFGEAFTREMVAGAGIIVAAGIFTFWRERVRKAGAHGK